MNRGLFRRHILTSCRESRDVRDISPGPAKSAVKQQPMTMISTRNLRNGARLLRYGFAAAALSLLSAVAARAETVTITTGNWLIHKPSKEYKDLPTLLADDDNAFRAGIGKIDFVCLKSNYYILLVQPSVKLRDTETATISVRAVNAPSVPAGLTFRNLYKTKTLLSRSMDWDADIHYAEFSAALLMSIKTADILDLTLAGKSYSIGVPGLGTQIGPFQRFCEQGVVESPAHFEKQ
jgi:hypothetical protein